MLKNEEVTYLAVCPNKHKAHRFITGNLLDKFFLLCPHCGTKMILSRMGQRKKKGNKNDDTRV